MRREYPIPALLHSYLFPDLSPTDPKDFQTHLAKNLVSEVRHETQRFYGGLETVEARYPGLNYSYGPHRKRLGRFPHHARLFRAFDALGLTDHEIAILCRWEGTLWARQRYERDEGIKVVDTTGQEILPCAERRHLKRKAADRTEARPVVVRVPSAEGIKVKTEIEIEIGEVRGMGSHAQIMRSRAELHHPHVSMSMVMPTPRAMQSQGFHRHDSPLRNSPYRSGPQPTSMLVSSTSIATPPQQQQQQHHHQALPPFIASPPMTIPLPIPNSIQTYQTFPPPPPTTTTAAAIPESRIPTPPALQQIIVAAPTFITPDSTLDAYLKESGVEGMSASHADGSGMPSRQSLSPSPGPVPVAVGSDGRGTASAVEGQGQSVLSEA